MIIAQAFFSYILKHTLTTTWPCFTEAMYLLHRSSGYRAQENLWAFLERRVFLLHLPASGEADRMRLLMRQYQDAPMDFADASLIAAAETLRADRIFTLDRHFHTYRTAAGHLQVVP